MRSLWAGFVLCVAFAGSAHALDVHQRPDWVLGIGMGYGRGAFERPTGVRDSYRNGAAPAIHFARLFGQHVAVGLTYEGWMLEFGSAVTDTVAVKVRRNLQTFGAAVTVYPGSPTNATNGIFLRATAGWGWAGTAGLLVESGEPQHNAPRIDEWGLGTSASAGYEFWIARNFTAGLGVGFNYLDLGGQLVDRGAFAAMLLNVNLYF